MMSSLMMTTAGQRHAAQSVSFLHLCFGTWMGLRMLNQQHMASHCCALHSGGAWMRRGTGACSRCSSRSGQPRHRRSTALWTLRRTTRQRASRGARRATAARPHGQSMAGVPHCKIKQAHCTLPHTQRVWPW